MGMTQLKLGLICMVLAKSTFSMEFAQEIKCNNSEETVLKDDEVSVKDCQNDLQDVVLPLIQLDNDELIKKALVGIRKTLGNYIRFRDISKNKELIVTVDFENGVRIWRISDTSQHLHDLSDREALYNPPLEQWSTFGIIDDDFPDQMIYRGIFKKKIKHFDITGIKFVKNDTAIQIETDYNYFNVDF